MLAVLIPILTYHTLLTLPIRQILVLSLEAPLLARPLAQATARELVLRLDPNTKALYEAVTFRVALDMVLISGSTNTVPTAIHMAVTHAKIKSQIQARTWSRVRMPPILQTDWIPM